jgi:hypothetical protein
LAAAALPVIAAGLLLHHPPAKGGVAEGPSVESKVSSQRVAKLRLEELKLKLAAKQLIDELILQPLKQRPAAW